MKEFLKQYFRTLLKHEPQNMKFGDTLKMCIKYQDKNGKWHSAPEVSINKSEL